ncbi:SDR family oxidoreductase [Candidatus Thiothrix sp. Deng01]|uniref:SDR family oxidoreductase n=1 Tax=Candidatus Thiothrix phosphatis TaxID=3112415 RepID=A0ABU6CYY1_9GAMM|nr:SDR family oxidoreductase [Candidatus Thiothrix sp. Deng01]MEB4592019.1 SDR family oxidoreductase [Candidatus Thiothrix sp. Deng01]
MNTFSLAGKTALVTGANRGIGAALVEALAAAGVKKIYAAARNITSLEPLTQRYPDQVEPILLDVTNPAHIAAVAEQIPALDILINNAGIASGCNLTSANTLETTRREMETNFFAPLQLTPALLPQLRQSEQAAIVNVASIISFSNFPTVAPYSISKAAMHSYTQGLRAELAADGILVIGVYPGPVDTGMTAEWDMAKTSPAQIASNILQALGKGETYVFPDDFSTQMYAQFRQDPLAFEKTLAGMV